MKKQSKGVDSRTFENGFGISTVRGKTSPISTCWICNVSLDRFQFMAFCDIIVKSDLHCEQLAEIAICRIDHEICEHNVVKAGGRIGATAHSYIQHWLGCNRSGPYYKGWQTQRLVSTPG